MSEVTYPGTYDSPNFRKYTSRSRIYSWHLRLVLDEVDRLVASTNPKTVLDAGCGEGFGVDSLRRRLPDAKITGVDQNENAVAYARERFGQHGTFRTGSLYKLPFSDRSFDTVLCIEVLEHLDEPLKAIQELKRVARGSVVVGVPLEPYFQWLNRLGQRFGISLDPGHVNFWTRRTFENLMQHHFEEPEFTRKHTYQFMLARM